VTYLRCGGIFNDSFVANLLESVSEKEFLKCVNTVKCKHDIFTVS